MKSLDVFALAWFAAFSVLTFLALGFDKRRSARSGQRVPEFTLILLAALGGWPGGLFGMNVFRHKTAKGSFKLKFACALLPFAAVVLAWWHWR